MCSDPARDSHRYADWVDAALAAGEAKPHKRYTLWVKRIRAKPAPRSPLRAPLRRKNGPASGDDRALVAAIR